jgi:hypothetical protein
VSIMHLSDWDDTLMADLTDHLGEMWDRRDVQTIAAAQNLSSTNEG